VLDASAVLAYLQGETGHDSVAGLLDQAVMSSVNAAEVVGLLAARGATRVQAERLIRAIQIPMVGFGAEHVLSTGMLRAATKDLGLSLGDRACLATAELLGATVVTADRAWADLKLRIPIQLIR
jgi:PIN domain nuclease of toxin-antitoxin system